MATTPALQGLQTYNPLIDPSGNALRAQAQQTNLVSQQQQMARDYGSDGSTPDVLAQGVHAQGPLHDPNWDAFFQALNNSGASKLKGGPSPAGSVQITGLQSAI